MVRGKKIDNAILSLSDAIDKAGLKVTFGLQPNQIEIIEKEIERFGNREVDGKYVKYIWEKLADELAWQPFTLALYYFRYLEHSKSYFSLEDILLAITYGFEYHRDSQNDNIDVPKGNKLQWLHFIKKNRTIRVENIENKKDKIAKELGYDNWCTLITTCCSSNLPHVILKAEETLKNY